MAFTQKPSRPDAVNLTGDYHEDFPAIPDDIKRRFPSAEDWQEGLSDWLIRFKASLVRDLEDLSGSISGLSAQLAAGDPDLTAQLTAATAAITALTARVVALESAAAPSASPAITGLTSSLAAHIAAHAAHGTLSDIVGKTDVQAVESKTIGLVAPGQGRFLSVINASSIPFGKTVVIQAGCNMVVGGTYAVAGTLVVEGTLSFV